MVTVFLALFGMHYLGLNTLRSGRSGLGSYRLSRRPCWDVSAGAPDGGGKFVQFGESEAVPAAFGPLGCLVAGLGEEELGIVGDVIDTFRAESSQVPIVVLSQSDMTEPLRKALVGLAERDCVIPVAPAQVASPFVLLSGLEQQALQGIVAMLVQARDAGSIPKGVAFAVAVPRAMDKTLAQIYREVADDQRANSR